MGLSSGVDLAGSTPELRPIVSDADGLLLARALSNFVLESNLENLEVNHLLILEGCVSHQCNTSELTQEWTEVFEGLQGRPPAPLSVPYRVVSRRRLTRLCDLW